MSKDTILFIFEGENPERQIFENIEKIFFLPNGSKAVIMSFFRGEIFQLWNEVKDDSNLEIVKILAKREEKEKNPNPVIKNLTKKEVSEVHLFFDHDAHSVNMKQPEYHEKILNLINTFNDEYEMGKLWISYPMVEALRHCKRDTSVCFNDAHIKISENNNYKNYVHNNSDFKDIRKFEKPVWYFLSAVNIQRTYCLVNDEYMAISDYGDIKKWFDKNANFVRMIEEKQYSKFINLKNEVVVLSPFPLFLLYYFGESFFGECKCEQVIKTCSFSCYQK